MIRELEGVDSAVVPGSPKGSADGLYWLVGVKHLCLGPALLVPPSCTGWFAVAYVLLDTVKNYPEMVLFCEVSNTL